MAALLAGRVISGNIIIVRVNVVCVDRRGGRITYFPRASSSPRIQRRRPRRQRRRSSLDPPDGRGRTDGGKGAEPLFVLYPRARFCCHRRCRFIDSSSARSSPEAFVKEDEGVTYCVAERPLLSLLRCCLLLSDHQSPESFCHCTVASVPLPPSLLCVKGAVFSGGSRISCSRASRAEQTAEESQRQLLLLIFPICGGSDSSD